jgi:hypothetical protein
MRGWSRRLNRNLDVDEANGRCGALAPRSGKRVHVPMELAILPAFRARPAHFSKQGHPGCSTPPIF